MRKANNEWTNNKVQVLPLIFTKEEVQQDFEAATTDCMIKLLYNWPSSILLTQEIKSSVGNLAGS